MRQELYFFEESMIYTNTIQLIQEAITAQEYFCFLCGNPSDVNQQFDEKACFPLGFLYYPSSQIRLVNLNDHDIFTLTIELMDLDEIDSTTEDTKLAVITRMYDTAKNVIAYLNQRSEGFDLFRIDGITINPLPRVKTNNRVTSGVRLDFTFTPEPEFAYCYL